MSTTIAMPGWCWLVAAALLVLIIWLVYLSGYYHGQYVERWQTPEGRARAIEIRRREAARPLPIRPSPIRSWADVQRDERILRGPRRGWGPFRWR